MNGMKEIILDAALVFNRDSLHTQLKSLLKFPGYSGENLDVLFDNLCALTEETQLTVINHGVLIEQLGDYGKMILLLFKDAADHNENFIFVRK